MTTSAIEENLISEKPSKLPRAFILRRLHSIVGLWLVVFLCEHFFVNSLAAIYAKDSGQGFIAMVNHIYKLPFLPVIEVVFLGIPFLIHMIWGTIYLITGKPNSFKTDGSSPALSQFKRNRAYTWQRITSWILLIGVVAHVVQLRFVEYPTHLMVDGQTHYMVKVSGDPGLNKLASNLDLELLDVPPAGSHLTLKPGQLFAVAKSPGAGFFLVVRNMFKRPVIVVLYSIFVLAAGFHALNGLWTALITWGITISTRSQKIAGLWTKSIMVLVLFLAMAAIWGTYWTTLIEK